MTIDTQTSTAVARYCGSKVKEALKTIVLLTALTALTGCASLTMDRKQSFAVQTSHGNTQLTGITCALHNDEGTWSLTSPASVTVHKSAGDLIVDCRNDHLSGSMNVGSTVNAAYASNFLFLFGVGYLVDQYTGAGFDYPAAIVVPLTPINGAGSPVASAVSTLSNDP